MYFAAWVFNGSTGFATLYHGHASEPHCTSPCLCFDRPSSGDATKLPSALLGVPNAQSPQPNKASAFLSGQAQQQADRVLCTGAQPSQKHKSGDEAISAKLSRIPSASPQHQRHLKVDMAPATSAAARPASSGDDAPKNRNPSSLPVRAKGHSESQERRRSSTGPYISGSTSPTLRCAR